MATYTSSATLDVGAWLAQLQPASWRGIGFAVDSSSVRRGRRTAVHEYPFRNDVWVEDLGRGPRAVAFSGFVVGDDCYTQAQALLAASETAGSGELIHPSLGSLTVALVSPMESTERKELGRVVEIRFEFLETGTSVYPDSGASTPDLSDLSADDCDVAVQDDFLDVATGAAGALAQGLAVVRAAVTTATVWVARVAQLAGDAALVVSAVAGLPGQFGRYAEGARSTLFDDIDTVEDALLGLSAARANITSCGAATVAAAAAMSSASTATSPFVPAVQATTAALLDACSNPADAVRLLGSLASWSPTTATSTAPIGTAIATITTTIGQAARRAALTSLARACALYEPSSYDDALALRTTVAPLFDAEILVAADAGQDGSYQALRSLRAAVLNDLITRGADLARLATITTNTPQPSLMIAYRQYRDAGRSDDLIARAKPVHPGFMPVSFEALSS